MSNLLDRSTPDPDPEKLDVLRGVLHQVASRLDACAESKRSGETIPPDVLQSQSETLRALAEGLPLYLDKNDIDELVVAEEIPSE